MEQMNKFTLLNVAMRILSSKICLMKKRHENVITPLRRNIFVAACFLSSNRNIG